MVRLFRLLTVTLVFASGHLGAGAISARPDLAIREVQNQLQVFVTDRERGLVLSSMVAPGRTRLRTTELERHPVCDAPIKRPAAITLRGSRLVIVDSTTPPIVFECNLDTQQLRVLWQGELLRVPSSVAVAADNTIVILDRELRGLLFIDAAGKARFEPKLQTLTSLQADEAGVLYAADSKGGILAVDPGRGQDSGVKQQSAPSSSSGLVVTLPSGASAFAVHREVFYVADPSGVRVMLSDGRLSLGLPEVGPDASAVAASQHYLATIDRQGEVMSIVQRPLPATVVLDHRSKNPNSAWIDLLTYLAQQRILTTRTIPRGEAARYEDVLRRSDVLIEIVMSPTKAALPAGSVDALFCALNGDSCAGGVPKDLPTTVVVPRATPAPILQTETKDLEGKSVRRWVEDNVLIKEQRDVVNDYYLARHNTDVVSTLEVELDRRGLVLATPMRRELSPGTVIRLTAGREEVVGALSSMCDVALTPRSQKTSMASPLDAPREALASGTAAAAGSRVTLSLQGLVRESISLSGLASCRPTKDTTGLYVVVESLGAMEVVPGAAGATQPLYFGYKPISLSALAAGAVTPMSDTASFKPAFAAGTSLWSRSTGTFTLPVTRWKAEVLLPARDYYASSGRLHDLRKKHAGLDLSSRERFGMVKQSAVHLHRSADDPIVEQALAASAAVLRRTIFYDEEGALASGTEGIYVGVIEDGNSLNQDHPAFIQDGLSAWYELDELTKVLRRRAVPGGVALTPPQRLRRAVPEVEHGTHVAGLIGARSNSLVPGLVPDVNMVHVPNNSVADLKDFIERADGLGISIINISQGFPPTSADVIAELHEAAKASKLLFVVAAGNEGANANQGSAVAPVSWSRSLPNVITVAALDETGGDIMPAHQDSDEKELTKGSNFGASFVDLGAPGKLVHSLGKEGYAFACGSSHAVPLVAATAAMLNTELKTVAELRARLLYTAEWSPSYAGRLWAGRLNVKRALFFPRVNVLEPDSDHTPYSVIWEGGAKLKIDGNEILRDGTKKRFKEEVPLVQVLRLHSIGGGKHRLVFMRKDVDTIAMVEGQVNGDLTCKSMKHFDPKTRKFVSDDQANVFCGKPTSAGQIFDYVAATTGRAKFE